MEFIGCVQGQGEGSRGPPVLVPISEGIPQDVLESFGVQESQEDCQEIGLVAFMFFFELLFFMFLSPFPSMFLLLTYSQSFFSLSADYPRHSRQRRSKI